VCVCVCVCVCVRVCVYASMLPWVFHCVLAWPTNLFGMLVCPFVSISAYIRAMTCLSVCCVCLRGCIFRVSIIFPLRLFACLSVSICLSIRDSICVSVCLCVSPPPPALERTFYWKENKKLGGWDQCLRWSETIWAGSDIIQQEDTCS
jgi:hypothetical protein